MTIATLCSIGPLALFTIPITTSAQINGIDPLCIHDATHFRCVQFIENYDGDTISFEIPNVHPLLGHIAHVRVLGIDAPEIHTDKACERAAAQKAKELVTSLLVNAKRIDLTDVSRDKYFRIDANVIADGKDIGATVLAAGLAYKYDGGTKGVMDWCGVAK